MNGERNLEKLAKEIVEQARQSFDFRRKIPRDIPEDKESAVMGFSPEDLDLKKILDGLSKGKIKGIAILSGSNNVKFTQDRELLTIAQEFLKNDILCISEGEASISLAKYGFLNPSKNDVEIGKGEKGTVGDCWDRCIVRCREIEHSLRIIEQAIDNIPEGDVSSGRGAPTESACS